MSLALSAGRFWHAVAWFILVRGVGIYVAFQVAGIRGLLLWVIANGLGNMEQISKPEVGE